MINIFKKKSSNDNLYSSADVRGKYDVILHIGAPKTGSSALQKFFVTNTDTFHSKGFYYPEHKLDKNGVSGGHSELALKLIENRDEDAKKHFSKLLKKAKKEKKVLILSSEAFYIRPDAVCKLLEGLNCKVVGFFRDPIESINSNYNQGVKRNFSTATPAEFCRRLLNEQNSFYDGHVLKRWSEIFGEGNVDIYAYDLDFFSHFPIQKFFLKALGISEKEISKFSGISKNKVVNRSYNFSSLELKRLLNHVLDRKKHSLNHELDWFLQEYSDKNEEPSIPLHRRLDPSVHEELEKRLRNKANENLKGILKNNHLFVSNADREAKKELLPHSAELFCSMYSILNNLEISNYSLFTYLKSQAQLHLKNNTIGADALKLADLFNIKYKKSNSKGPWFTSSVLAKMTEFDKADFLREVAYLSYERGDKRTARTLIEKARVLRPSGPFIVAFSDKLKDETG